MLSLCSIPVHTSAPVLSQHMKTQFYSKEHIVHNYVRLDCSSFHTIGFVVLYCVLPYTIYTLVHVHYYFASLQVTVTKDSSSNDYSLDAGALVLADQGVCHVNTLVYIMLCTLRKCILTRLLLY